MSRPEPKFSKEEFLKEGSHQLRGTIAQELSEGTDNFVEDNAKLLKHHGTYQQDDKDHRKDKNADGSRKGKAYMFMVRTRVPGGKVTADQLLAELDLCEQLRQRHAADHVAAGAATARRVEGRLAGDDPRHQPTRCSRRWPPAATSSAT